MSDETGIEVRKQIEEIYRSDSRRVLATLIRLLGGFEAAEEATHDAFMAALDSWPKDGIPQNPRAWLISTGRFKAIDVLRRRARYDAALAAEPQIELQISPHPDPDPDFEQEGLEDDRLRLIFTCCHPSLTPDAQIALTLREVCGLETEQIARAFFVPAPTLAQRIVRAKGKIHDAHIPYQVPSPSELPERIDAVLHVIYLVFNEGYSASSGESVVRHDLCAEAIRLARLLTELLPEPEALGLLALMLLHDARRPARTSPARELILLEEQDRSLWNREQIREGISFVEKSLASRRFGPYTLQAAIAAVHADAPTATATDWRQIAGLYDVLMRVDGSAVIELNRAVAIAMCEGAESGLAIVDAILARGDLADYPLAHSARADLCRRLGRWQEAADSYKRAVGLTTQAPERRFLEQRLAELATNRDRE